MLRAGLGEPRSLHGEGKVRDDAYRGARREQPARDSKPPRGRGGRWCAGSRCDLRQGVRVLVRVATGHDVPQGESENAQVEPQRPVVDVIEVILYPLAEIAAPAQVVDLRPAGDPRLDHV